MTYYAKVGQTIYEEFVHATSGLLDAAFTKELTKDGVNVAAPPGITITNISAGNRYAVTINGATAFPSATGTYALVIYETALPLAKYETIIAVTSNGLPSGTTGSVSFTATASDGRITDGASPLDGATITIRRPTTGAFYTQTVSDASGLWGPVYFDATGTFTATVQKSGYSLGSFSITVTALAATGPGTDIALTALASSSGLTLSSLAAYARRMFVGRQGAQATTEITEAINEALSMVCSQRDWPWLYTVGRITLRGLYSTGTVAVVDGDATVTLTGGTFPAWTASGDILINSVWTPVDSLTSGTVLEMADAYVGTSDSAASYTLVQYRYDLPSDCRNIMAVMQVPGWIWGIEPIGRYELELMRNLNSGPSPRYAVQSDQLAIWPAPEADCPANLLYIRMPATLVSPTDEADWDPLQLELLHRAIDFQIACRGSCVAGDKPATFKSYQECMARVSSNDRTSRPVGFSFGGRTFPQGIPSTGNRFT